MNPYFSVRGAGATNGDDSQLLNAHNSFLKTQCDGLKCELSVREAEISSLKTRLESTERTNQETRLHLEGNSFFRFSEKNEGQ